jgi:two-component system invasion response regulator UvrY
MTRAQPISVIIVDDHRILESWKELLEYDQRLRVLAVCKDGEEALAKISAFHPDVALVDVKMKPINGFELTETICRDHPSTKVIGLSVSNQLNYVEKMMKAGAKGYLTKTSSLDEINLAIMEVHKGSEYICEEIKKKHNS